MPFAFTIADDDLSRIAELLRQGVRIVVDIDTTQGGILMMHRQTSLSWAWLEEIDSDACGDVESESFTDAEEAVAAALSAAAGSDDEQDRTTARWIELEVSKHDFDLLFSLEQAGFVIWLSLDPHGGGIDAIHASGISLKWSFISAIELYPEVEDGPDEDDLAGMLSAFKRAIRG